MVTSANSSLAVRSPTPHGIARLVSWSLWVHGSQRC